MKADSGEYSTKNIVRNSYLAFWNSGVGSLWMELMKHSASPLVLWKHGSVAVYGTPASGGQSTKERNSIVLCRSNLISFNVNSFFFF